MRRWLPALLLALVVLIPAGSGAADASGGAVAAKARLKVTCDQMTDEIRKTAQQFAARYQAMGFNVIVAGSYERCTKIGKRIRQGKGYMSAKQPLPGEPDPGVAEHIYTWTQVVARTKMGALRSIVSNFACERVMEDNTSRGPCVSA